MKKIMALLLSAVLLITCFGNVFTVSASGADIKLDNPPQSLHVDLMDALRHRQSTRSGFTSQEISRRDLATILWAANGINRKSGQRTAPAALGKYFIALYLAANDGVYQYDPVKNLLKWVSDQNIKDRVGGQSDIGTASHVLIMVADLRLLPSFMAQPAKLAMAHGTAGTIAENVYLAAAALKLGTRMVAGVKESDIRKELQLSEEEVPLYIMPLGYIR